jgi:glycosyltransferase involved in cell wall biosynthesis
MPTHNRAEDLAKRFEELRVQTLSDFEFVVLDDASTDGTAEVVRRAAQSDGRIRYVPLRPAVRMPGVIARCFSEASAPLVAIFHDHDSYRPDALSELKRVIDAVPDAPYAFCGVRTLDPLTGVLRDDSSDPSAPQARDDVVRTFIARGTSLVGASAVMIRKDRLPPEPIVSSELGLFADVELWCRMALDRHPAYAAGPLVDVQGWTEAESLSKLDWPTIRRLTDLRLEFARKYGFPPSQLRRLEARIRLHGLRQRGFWMLRLFRHAWRGREDLGRALASAPATVSRVALGLRNVSAGVSRAVAR